MSAAAASPRSRAAVRQRWLDRFDRFTSAGLSVTAFCRTEGISCQAFYCWKHKLAAQAPPPVPEQFRLLAVRLLAAPSPVAVVLPHGTVLRLAPDCDLVEPGAVTGSEAGGETAALLYTVVGTCKHLGIDPFACLKASRSPLRRG